MHHEQDARHARAREEGRTGGVPRVSEGARSEHGQIAFAQFSTSPDPLDSN